MIFQFNPLFPDASNDAKWEQIKVWRNAELAATDFTQLPDAAVDKQAWAEYRQALRDLPAQGVLADDAEFPERPNGTL